MTAFRVPTRTPPPDEVRTAEEHLRLAQEAGGIGTWEWHLASDRMVWSAQMFRNLGLCAATAPAASCELLLAMAAPEDRPQVAALLAEFCRRTGPMRIEYRIAQPGGPVRWVVLLGKVEGDEQGRPARMLGVSIESTRRRAMVETAEAALRDRERLLRELNEQLERLANRRTRQLDASRAQIQAMFDNSPDWLTVFRATSDGRFVYEDINKATEIGYGLSRDRVIGRPVEEILGLEQAQVPLAHMRACTETGETQRYTARRTMAGVTRTVDVMFARVPEKHDDDWLIISTARDITDREAMELQLRQAQKMEALGQLTGGIAHDFNNLLTAIIGNLELLRPSVAADPKLARHAAAAQRAAENGARLTEQLLAFSRRQHLQPRPVDLNAVVRGMREILTRTIGTTIAVRNSLSDDLWPALVDPTQVEIAILNLAINARDAMPLGGTLTIETRNLPAGAAAPAELAGQDCIAVSVRDTGTGMSEDVLRFAVEPFFTTKEPGKGSGLGLSQVYGMAQQSNGALHIESRVGAGTAVHLFLPRSAAAARTADPSPGETAIRDTAGRILVVDDDPGVRDITVQMLRQSGYVVAEAESGQAAIEILGRGEAFDLVAVDVAMPGCTGIETIERARRRWPGLRALYITGYADPGAANLETGGEPILKKPFRLNDLQQAVRDALNRRPDRVETLPQQRGKPALRAGQNETAIRG